MRGLNLSYEKKKGLYGYGFIALWFVGALIFFIIPVIKSFIYSFYDVKPDVGQLIMSPLGLDNYKRAFMTDPDFRKIWYQFWVRPSGRHLSSLSSHCSLLSSLTRSSRAVPLPERFSSCP